MAAPLSRAASCASGMASMPLVLSMPCRGQCARLTSLRRVPAHLSPYAFSPFMALLPGADSTTVFLVDKPFRNIFPPAIPVRFIRPE